MAGDESRVRQIAQQAIQNISQLLQVIGDGTNSSATGAARLPNVQSVSNNVRQRQVEEHEGSTLPVVTDSRNRYHPYNRYSPNNAVAELRRRFPTTSVAATRQGSRQSRLISSNATGQASRGRSLGRPFASSTVARDVMVLKAGEDTIPSKSQRSQLELDGCIITGFDVNRSWEQEQLFTELEAILPDKYKGVNFQIMKNCHGNLIQPNIPKGRKIDAQLLLRSIAPSSCIYIQLLHDPIPDDMLDVPVFEKNEEIVTEGSNGKGNSDVGEDPSNSVDNMGSEQSFIQEILQGVPEMLSDPSEILKYLQQQVVTGRPLEISSADIEITGETNYITVDRTNIIQTTFDELQFVTNPRVTFQVDFMGEDSVDLGGPRKEWIRLLNREIKAKYFDHGLRPLLARDYFYIGQIFAIALLQNGQVPSFLSEVILQELAAVSSSNQCIKEIQSGLETLGMYSAFKKFPQLLKLVKRPSGNAGLTVQKLLKLLKPAFSEDGTNAFQQEKVVYSSFVRYIKEVAANRRVCGQTNITLGHILQFVTGASEEPVLGFELHPSLTFVIPQEQVVEDFQADSSDGEKVFKTIANFLPSAHTCSNVLTLPRPTVAFQLPEVDSLFNMYDICFGQEYFGIQ